MTLFSFTIIMLGIDSNVSSVIKTPLPIGLLIILTLWIFILLNLYFSRIICNNDLITQSAYPMWVKIIIVTTIITGIICVGFGIFSLPVSISRYAKGLPLRFWFSSALIFSALLKLKIVKYILRQNLKFVSTWFIIVGLLDLFIAYAFLPRINKITINLYATIFFIIPAIYFLALQRRYLKK